MSDLKTDRHPVNSQTDKDTGNRWYIHPTTGERFISVTTVLGNIAKFGITPWAAKLSATAAFDRLPALVRASRMPLCNLTETDDACGTCRDCVTFWLADRHNQVRDDAADLGIKLHDVAESDALFGEGAHIDEDVRPFVEQFRKWRGVYQPKFLASEMTVISRKWGYAGTLDAILRIAAMPKPLEHLSGLPSCTDWKGLALDTPLPTPTGWTTMRAVQVGDELFDAAGKACRVTGKSDIKTVDCYRLKFDDATEIVCDAEHLWPVRYGDVGQFEGALTAETIARTLFIKATRGPRRHHRIAVAAPLDLPAVELPVEPYTFGCWLGDGTRSAGTISKPDDELFELITASSGLPCAPRPVRKDKGCATRTVYGLRTKLRLAGYLNNKAIPDAYLRSSVAQRLALLQGLMDTDGSHNPQRRRCLFTSTDKRMALAVQELALSLGERAVVDVRSKRGFGVVVTAYTVSWRPVRFNPFRLTRKAALVDTLTSRSYSRSGRRLVVSAERTITVPTQCIEVDSPDHTYLCGEQMTPTHNTSKSVDIAKGWQVVAYSNADAVLLPDGSELPMPEIKGGLIVHIRPDKVQMREVHLTDQNFQYFIHMLRVVEGLSAGLNTVLSRPVTLKEN